MDEKIFAIVLACVPLLGTIITVYIIPLIKNKIGTEQLDTVAFWVGKAVEAAEVLFNVPKSGEQKKAYVVDFINKMFNSKKTVITEDQIEILLEAAVKEMTGK